MLRVISSLLSFNDNGKCLYNGVEFTGAAFVCESERVVKAIVFNNGDIEGDYSSDLVLTENNALPVYIEDFLDGGGESYDPFCLNGKLIDGLVFTFEKGGFCTEERLVKNGETIESVGHYPSGFMDVYWEGFYVYQYYEWPDGGVLRELDLANQEPCRFRFHCYFDVEGCLKSLNISGDFLKGVRLVENRLRYPEFIDFDFLCKPPKNSSKLIFIGEGVNHSIFNEFLGRNYFSYINKLEFYRTSISPSDIESLAKFKNLKELCVELRGDFDLDFKVALSKLKQRLPGCVVKLGEKVLM